MYQYQGIYYYEKFSKNIIIASCVNVHCSENNDLIKLLSVLCAHFILEHIPAVGRSV